VSPRDPVARARVDGARGGEASSEEREQGRRIGSVGLGVADSR